MRVRKLRKNEYRKLLKMMRRIYPSELGGKTFVGWYSKSGGFPYVQWFVADKGGEIAGFTRWCLDDAAGKEIILELSWTAVKSKYEGAGLAANLVHTSYETVRSYWRRKGMHVSGIWAQTDTRNKRAIKFYKKVMADMGFSIKEIRTKGMWKKWKNTSIVFICGSKKGKG